MPTNPYAEKTVLVTGGTGSFGNFVVRRLLELGAREVRVLSRDEKKQYDMRVFYQQRPDLAFIIGDVRSPAQLDEAMSGAHIIFHAAALKQVPTCEQHPMEAVRTNVLGANNLIEAAMRHRLEAFVMISTDKAVKPVNVMGMTKALQERLVIKANQSRANHGTRFAAVRYGNVLRSRGSVIPHFRRQLQLNQQITITDERMTRFWITLQHGVNFVVTSFTVMRGGEIFVPKIPSMRIVDLAHCLAPGLPLRVVGIRPGEKLHEVMVTEDDSRLTLELGDRYVIEPAFAWWQRTPYTASGARPVPDGFRFTSDTNTDWLTDERLCALVTEHA